MKLVPAKGKAAGGYQYTLAISPLDCMGCGVCIGQCPTDSLTMVPAEGELAEQEAFDYCVAHVADKPELADTSVKGSQFKRPLLEFSGACAGCAETSYAKLVTQMFGDRMYITNATGCSSIWGGPAATSPYTVNAEGHGPAWSNSLFEDNAEHGLGMLLGHEAVRTRLAGLLEDMAASDKTPAETKALIASFLETAEDGAANAEAVRALVSALEAAAKDEVSRGARDTREQGVPGQEVRLDLRRRRLGLRHRLRRPGPRAGSDQNVNVFVFDTEVYSNTGGQASKASNIGQVAQFAAAGKDIKKKSLTEIAISYGYVYVAQVAMGAKPAQTIKAIAEAEAYPGPSLIIGYSPCEMHSIKGGMANCQDEMKKAVDCGYWNLFRFNPAAPAGKKFVLDSKEPAGGYQEFLMNEARYSRLTREFPERAGELFERNELEAMKRYEHLLKLKEVYAEA